MDSTQNSLVSGDSLIEASGDSLGDDPGPIDPSVLYDQEEHVSAAVWEGLVWFTVRKLYTLSFLFFCGQGCAEVECLCRIIIR